MDIQGIKRDVAASTEGRWVKDIPQMGDLELLVRGDNSPKVEALRARKMRAVPKEKRGRDGQPVHSEFMRVLREVCHEVVLLGWKNITDGVEVDKDGAPKLDADGEQIPVVVEYSPELAAKWINDPNMHEFADAVAWASKAVAIGEAEETKAVLGNSPKP